MKRLFFPTPLRIPPHRLPLRGVSISISFHIAGSNSLGPFTPRVYTGGYHGLFNVWLSGSYLGHIAKEYPFVADDGILYQYFISNPYGVFIVAIENGQQHATPQTKRTLWTINGFHAVLLLDLLGIS